MRILFVFIFISISVHSQTKTDSTHIRFAFGSCIRHTADLRIFDSILKWQPDYTLLLGDIGYIDSPNQDTACTILDSIYSDSSFSRLRRFSTLYGTWDDHDYGLNDGGKYFPVKQEAKERFLDFYDVPSESVLREREGIYTSYRIYSNGKWIQLIFLDTRWFRSNLNVNDYSVNTEKLPYISEYLPYEFRDSTLLGKEQWEWLENQLKIPADLRIICSSIQFAHSYNGYESWNNFPLEKEKLFKIMKQNEVENLVFLSGDVHIAEISKQNVPDLYPIYDFTSSGLSSKWSYPIPNKNRIAGPIYENHFALLDVNWTENKLIVSIVNRSNQIKIQQTILLSELKFK